MRWGLINFAAECFCANIDTICALYTIPITSTLSTWQSCTYFLQVVALDVDILRTEEALILFVGDAHSPKVTLHEMALSCKLRSRKWELGAAAGAHTMWHDVAAKICVCSKEYLNAIQGAWFQLETSHKVQPNSSCMKMRRNMGKLCAPHFIRQSNLEKLYSTGAQ